MKTEPVKVFQLKHDLTPDGEIGAKTCAKMREVWNLSKEELAHFLGQCSVETADFTIFEENLNYSAVGLSKIFPKYFPTKELCNKYAKNPSKIANIVYANRMGNGNVNSADGWKHRGYGALQVTGKENQRLFSKFVNDLEINDDPSIIAKKYAFESGIWFFSKNKVWKYSTKINEDSILDVSKCVNIGNVKSNLIPNHYQERILATQKYYNLQNN